MGICGEKLQRAGGGVGRSDLGHGSQLQFMSEWCPWKADIEWMLGILHQLNMNGWMAGNTLISGTCIQGTACEIWMTQIRSDSCWNGIHGKLLFNGQMAGNSLINTKYIQGAACKIWVAQISSDSCQNGVHGKPLLSGCWGYLIHSIQMGRRLAIV
ncbi:hypothetical protein F5J12DRAFT_783833 [Pisolithus orientalis]|uniref:uncharacterized protein n=1 Tax=Pisolithus orientalis TaxID=936130 RepID=UPI0022243F24|nr:uncharacterized protein F5J12DRAFT_783833 [Pisolithus orientalis]KAI6002676.1 hypothetical protein F5J12DRAFT_783833 [Pisolithus orientalis]